VPQRADAGPSISVDVDVDQKYIVEVIGISEVQAQWDNAKDGDMSITWKFILTDQDGNVVIDNNSGDQYELWNFTNDKTYFNPKTGKKAKAREWTEALVGRDLTDEEMNDLIDLGFEESLLHKKGLADIEWYLTKTGNERLRIIRLRPYRKGKPQAVETPDPVLVEELQTAVAAAGTKPQRSAADVAERRRKLGLDDAS
jgi:hypothetical protein